MKPPCLEVLAARSPLTLTHCPTPTLQALSHIFFVSLLVLNIGVFVIKNMLSVTVGQA